MWAELWTDLPKLIAIKAVVFDLNFDLLKNFLKTSSTSDLSRIQVRLVFTRATAVLWKGAVQQLLAQVQVLRGHVSALPLWASGKCNPLAGLSIHYVASFYPKNLNFDKTRLHREIQGTTQEGIAPIRTAIKTALRDRDNVES